MARNKYRTRHDIDEVPFEYDGKMLVFATFDDTFYNYNIVNTDGNFRGTHQSKVKLH